MLVTQKDIAKYPPASPQRTLMSWWRAMQYTDGRGYLALLATPLRNARQADRAYRVQLPIIARQVDDAFPHITQVSIEGDKATVYTELEFRQLVGADKYATTRVAQAFSMVRESGIWRIADDLFVEAGVQDQLRAMAQQDAKAGVRAPATRPTPTPALRRLRRRRRRHPDPRPSAPGDRAQQVPARGVAAHAPTGDDVATRAGDRPRRRPGRGAPVVPARNGEDVDRRQAGAPQARAEARRREVRQVLGARERRPAQPQPGRAPGWRCSAPRRTRGRRDEPAGDVAQHRDRVAGVLEDVP